MDPTNRMGERKRRQQKEQGEKPRGKPTSTKRGKTGGREAERKRNKPKMEWARESPSAVSPTVQPTGKRKRKRGGEEKKRTKDGMGEGK